MLMNETERVADFVADGVAVPRGGAEFRELLAVNHADGGLSAAQSIILAERDVIGFHGARDEMEIGEGGPFGGAIEHGLLFRRGHGGIEIVVDVAIGPCGGGAIKGEFGLRRAGELIAPSAQIGNENLHIADLRSDLAGRSVGQDLIQCRDAPGGGGGLAENKVRQ